MGIYNNMTKIALNNNYPLSTYHYYTIFAAAAMGTSDMRSKMSIRSAHK
jgi:hypothetical protein